MTIPPELAALQRYIHNSAKMAEVPSCQTLIGVRQFVELDDVARAWPQRASGEAAIYFCSGPSGSIWALDESEIEPTIKQFAEAHGDDPGEYTATPFYSKPADTSALRERLEAHWRHLVLMPDDGFKPLQEAEWIRTLLAGEGT